jgi:plasmid stability protein
MDGTTAPANRFVAALAAEEIASNMLAFCDMRTLYLRNVPDDVVERLERLAANQGVSVNAVAVRELAAVSRRADNPALLGALPDLGIDTDEIVANLESERATQ